MACSGVDASRRGRPMLNKTFAQASTTLVGVVALYVAPWMLGVVPHDLPTLEVVELPAAPREAVFWFPPAPQEDVEQVEDALALAPVVEEPAAIPVEQPDPPRAVEAPASIAPAAATAPAQRPRPERVKRAVRKRPVQALVAAAPPKAPPKPKVVLTPKQERQKERVAKRRERLAEQPQCRDHLDQILKIASTEDSEAWLVGEDLVSCYRAHPQQFMDMGGMEWAEEKGKKIGLRVYVSNRQRGEVARTLGFQKGDVLHSLNGFSLRNPATVTLALTQLTRNKAKLKYLRDGEKRVFEVQVVDLEELELAREELEREAQLAKLN